MNSISPRLIALGLSVVVAVGGTTSLVYAHSGAKGIVKERMEMMKGIGDAMKTMGAMLKDEAPFEPAIIAEQAAYLTEHARKIPDMTPEGSNDHPSEALAIIWLEWDDYVTSANKLADEGEKLVDVASNGADLTETRAQFINVSKTCGTCHDRFRKPKED